MTINIKKIFVILLILCGITYLGAEAEKDDAQKEAEKKQIPIIEEVVVTGKTPAQQPVSTVSLLQNEKLQTVVPKNLGEIMSYTTGTYVTDGSKGESQVTVRGMNSQRLTLLLDGIPIYEPYFNSFDLKSISASGIESIKVVKGSSSVLYGANALGGVINVVSQRPDKPFLALDASLGEKSTYYITGNGGYSWEKFALSVNASVDHAKGFTYKENGERIHRQNSRWQRANYGGKFYFYPSDSSEIMAQVSYYTADFEIPPALAYYRARYWVFKDWDRLQLNLGGTFPFLGKGLLKARSYYVRHFNVLDNYTRPDLQTMTWESTYKNDSFGGYLLAEYPFSTQNTLKFSLNANWNTVRQQGDIGDPWEEYDRQVYSFGIEEHLSLSPQWKVIAGSGVDYLEKHTGEENIRVNPLLGIKYAPYSYLDFHLTFSQKSRFPSMRALYGSTGNPDLADELGRSFEFGALYQHRFYAAASVFYNRYNDLIQAYRGLDGFKNYQNVGRAEIYGFELELGKKFGIFHLEANYTYLHHQDKDSGDRLDYIPTSQFNFFCGISNFKGFSFNLWGIAVTKAIVRLGSQPPFELLGIPGYTTFNARLDYKIGPVDLYIKADNLLDKEYYTEPGYPMKARTIYTGLQLHLERNTK